MARVGERVRAGNGLGTVERLFEDAEVAKTICARRGSGVLSVKCAHGKYRRYSFV